MDYRMVDVFAFRLLEALAGLQTVETTPRTFQILLAGQPPVTTDPVLRFYTYKSLGLLGDRANQERPFVGVFVPAQSQTGARQFGYPANHSGGQPTFEGTGITVCIETDFYVETGGGQQAGGFDCTHHPIMLAVRDFIHGNLALEVPTELHPGYKVGIIGVRRDVPRDESTYQPPSAEAYGQMFHVILTQTGES